MAAMADLFDVNAVTVESIDRSLSNAGLRRKGGRGRSAAHMTGPDVTHLAFALILESGMKDAPEKVGKVSRMPRQQATVQWRPDPDLPLSALAEQVEQYQEHPAADADLGVFPGGAALAAAETLGEGVAVLVDAMADGGFEALDDAALNLQMSNIGPSARLAYATRAGVLRLRYEASGPEAERPIFERRFKLDEALMRRLAEVIAPQ